jgi:hypothetical protein
MGVLLGQQLDLTIAQGLRAAHAAIVAGALLDECDEVHCFHYRAAWRRL